LKEGNKKGNDRKAKAKGKMLNAKKMTDLPEAKFTLAFRLQRRAFLCPSAFNLQLLAFTFAFSLPPSALFCPAVNQLQSLLYAALT
jgi:hypothetical protein